MQTDVSVTSQCEASFSNAPSLRSNRYLLVCNAGYGFHAPVAQTPACNLRRSLRPMSWHNRMHSCRVWSHAGARPRQGWRGQIMIVSSAVARRGMPFFGSLFGDEGRAALAGRGDARGSPAAADCRDQRSSDRHRHRVRRRLRATAAATVPAASPAKCARHRKPSQRKWSTRSSARVPKSGPSPPARWGVSIGTLLPSLVDRVMLRRSNELKGESGGEDDESAKR